MPRIARRGRALGRRRAGLHRARHHRRRDACSRERLGADGFNLLSNVGEVAGQSVFHLHVHVIPRFDANPGIEAMLDRDRGIVVAEVFARLGES